MKNKFVKFVTPALFVVAGIGGAFVTTSAQSTASLTQVPGYRAFNGNPCHSEIMCETLITPDLCTISGGVKLWGKENPSDTDCPVKLYRIQN
ncbi:hypothetical protein [Flavobacterium sp. PL02]|uniref:hypothetical protein n=1 Tax=Flavobacterium sp. PL02 TaxID=3088354 RepID=UPI002B23AB45|nr:hypothetical protein [Flavobacterium sp. PL02]MEA9414307.1 hypothetical protein [Flavobacterium sp. PL02]